MLIDLALREPRQRVVGLLFFGESRLKELYGLGQAKLSRLGLRRAVARDFIMLHRLSRREKAGVQGGRARIFLHHLPMVMRCNALPS